MAKQSKSDSKLFAFLATFFSIIGFIIALIAKKHDKYVMFYAKQSLVVFIVSVIASVLQWALRYSFIGVLLNLAVLVLWIFSWAYALSGKEKEVPIVGRYARKIEL